VPLGAVAIVRTGGGGGWGAPYDRDPAKVVDDMREECISRDAAHDLYGVVIDDDFKLDTAATDALRGEMRRKAGRNGGAAS
jgi:N-methylhydantoinase B